MEHENLYVGKPLNTLMPLKYRKPYAWLIDVKRDVGVRTTWWRTVNDGDGADQYTRNPDKWRVTVVRPKGYDVGIAMIG